MAKILFNERELLARLDYEQRAPRTLVDVGAHIGNFCRAFGDEGWRVIAFEPDPDNYQALQQRIATFRGGLALKKAVSNETGRGSFYRSTEYWGIHSLKPFHPSHSDRIDVELVRLDDALSEAGVDEVTVLKIDAEGADFLALQSFPFDRIRPEVVMVEFMDSRSRPGFGYDHHEVARYMADRGYVAYVSEWAPIEEHSKQEGGGGPFHFLQCAPYPLHHRPAWGNLIFVPPARREMFETRLIELLTDLDQRRQAALKAAAWGGSPRAAVVKQLKAQAKRVPGAKELWKLGRRAIETVSATSPAAAAPPAPAAAPPAARVGVVVSAADDAESLQACLASVAEQTYAGWSCQVVIDRGLRASISVAEMFAARDPRFHVVRHGDSFGYMTAGKNTGAASVDAEYLMLLEQSDRLAEQALAIGVAIADRARGRAEVAGVRFAEQINGPLPKSTVSGPVPKGAVSTPQVPAAGAVRVPLTDFVSVDDVSTRAVLVRRDVFVRFGGFDESLGFSAEADFWLRMLRHGYVLLPADRLAVSGERCPPASEDEFRAHARLRRWAETKLAPEEVVPESPFVHREPIGALRERILEKRRALEFLGQTAGRSELESIAGRYLTSQDLDRERAGQLLPRLYLAIGLAQGAGAERSALTDYLPEADAIWTRLTAALGRDKPTAAAPLVPKPQASRTPRTVAQQQQIQIAFMPHKDYHAWTMGKAALMLKARGVMPVIIDPTANYRDEGAQTRLTDLEVPVVTYNNYRLGQFSPKVLMVMSDWEPQALTLIEAAKAEGTVAVGLVEGVQDFTDADIKRDRRPYRRVDQVFLAGEFDAQFFPPSVPTQVVGVPRIDELKKEEPIYPEKPLVVVNSNFSYGVLDDARDDWLRSVADACRQVGVDMVVSRHPADRGDFSDYTVTPLSMYDAIRQGSVFVSRFGSGIIEALAMGKPSIYHNPHREQVIKFQEPLGGYPVTTSVSSLAQALEAELRDRADRRPRAKAFLDLHVAWSESKSSTEQLADALMALCTTG